MNESSAGAPSARRSFAIKVISAFLTTKTAMIFHDKKSEHPLMKNQPLPREETADHTQSCAFSWVLGL